MEATRLRAGTIRVRTPGMDLEPDVIWDVLGAVSEDYPQMDDYSAEAEKQKFKVGFRDERGDEQAFTIISKEGISVASQEGLTTDQWRKRYASIVGRIVEAIHISPLSMVHVDNQDIVTWNTDVHHGRILYSLFGKNSTLDKLFAGLAVVEYAPDALFWIDRENQIVCSLDTQSRSPVSADKLDVYPENYDLIVRCGIAKGGGSSQKHRFQKWWRMCLPFLSRSSRINFRKAL